MMSNRNIPSFRRPAFAELKRRLEAPRRWMQVVAGPRQVGKTTMVKQVLDAVSLPWRYATADEPGLKDGYWIASQWEAARHLLGDHSQGTALLALDEIQKIQGWSETVKRLWDEDTQAGRELQVVLLGSSAFMMQKGLSESLTGRFEVHRLFPWSFGEMEVAFGMGLEDYLYFGGYPGAAPLIHDPQRWRSYMLDSLIEPTITRDVLMMQRVDKPALLRQLFELGCMYSGQVLSLTKVLGQVQDAGNTTTLAYYLTLLQQAGLLAGLQKFSGQAVRQRASSPKFQVMNTGLLSALSGLMPSEVAADPAYRGRLVESAVGAHLMSLAFELRGEVFYWKEGNLEVDFIVNVGDRYCAFEVKSGAHGPRHGGLEAFGKRHAPFRSLIVGGDAFPLDVFLRGSASELWRPT